MRNQKIFKAVFVFEEDYYKIHLYGYAYSLPIGTTIMIFI